LKQQEPNRSVPVTSEPDLARRRLIVASVALSLFVALVIVAYRHFYASREHNLISSGASEAGRERSSVSLPPDIQPLVSLPPLASEYLNAVNAANYVGSESCGQCHPDQQATYLKTTHSRSLSLVDLPQEPPDGQFEHAPSGLRYEVHRQDGQVWHRESLSVGGAELEMADRPLKYLVGSGQFARTYLAEIDGFLIESPLSWYTSSRAWGMSPGYEGASHHSFQRNVTQDCLFCHSGRTSILAGSPSRVKLHEMAIGCERCHGPGSLHVDRQQDRQTIDRRANTGVSSDHTIVNPRSLSRSLSEAICQQCHLESIGAVTVQGRARDDFRPGLRWTDFCVNYDLQSPSGQMTVTGHVQQMHQSRCYQSSSTLTCITCHDMHAPPTPEQKVERYRTACLTCHEDASCKLESAERHRQNSNNCAACHMPRGDTNVPHVAFTHHRIGLHTGPPDQPADEFAAAPFRAVLNDSHLPEIHRQRNLGLAYLQRYVNFWNDARLIWYRQQADELLTGVYRSGLQDEAVTTALAAIAGDKGNLTAAEEYATRALASAKISPEDGVAARSLLANVYYHQQRFQDSERVLGELIQLRREARDWVLLGRCRERQNDLAGAISALQQILHIDPRMPETHEVLSELYGRQGAVEAQRASAGRARVLRANRPQ
jgi:tetratricopeptide (TPR) repeat protein